MIAHACSVRCAVSGVRLDVELLQHADGEPLVGADEQHRVTVLCSSENLARRLARSVESFDFNHVHSARGVVLAAVDAERGECRVALPAQVQAIMHWDTDHHPHQEVVTVHHNVEQVHPTTATRRANWCADDLHKLPPLVITEGTMLQGLPNEILIPARPTLAARFTRAGGAA